MKIRIKGNSVRIRLIRSEVNELATGGQLAETTEFPSGNFTYSLQAKEGITHLEADFSNGNMAIYIPASLPAPWAANEQVGFEHHLDLGHNRSLYLLIEKDFKCLDAPPHEDQSDNFDNPHKTC
jgi:hypothetical protein